MRAGIGRNDCLDQQQPGSWWSGSSHCLKNGNGLGIGPIVDDLHQQVAVADRQAIAEEVAGLKRQLGRSGAGRGIDDMRQVEQDDRHGRLPVKNGPQQMP